jgi:HAD superfamily hydrolase (TIGR01509 family)
MGAVAVGGVKAAELDAVTLDAYGTLVRILDPVPALVEALGAMGLERKPDVVLAGFRTESAYYVTRAHDGRDEESLIRLQRDSARVFLEAVGADLDAEDFAPVYAGAMRFEVMPGVEESLERLRALGLSLAVVGNWDLTLHRHLRDLGLDRYFGTVVHAAGKPAPAGLLQALEDLGVVPSRALHIGDDDVDEQAARAAGMRFAPAPVQDAVATIE